MSETKVINILPQDVSGLDIAFPATVKHLMPKYEDIPKEFHDGRGKWNQFFNDAFFGGVRNLKLTPKEGIDKDKAIRHVRCIMGSFEPKHEHKEAACAYLMSLWFTDGTWETAK